MFWQRTLQSIDVHCEGEIGRIISAGMLDVPGSSMAEKLQHLNTNAEARAIREFLTSEPRSNAAGSVVLLPPKCHPAADVGFLVLQPDQAHAMSGSNAICATTALLETGMIPMQEPLSTVCFDTAAGLVYAQAECAAHRCTRVRLNMPPAFAEALDVRINTGHWGKIYCDLAFGGVFYAIIPVEQIGLTITPDNARALAETGIALHHEIDTAYPLVHPQIPELKGLAYVMFVEQHDGFHRTCTTMRPGRLDRSPCGTGSNALLATLVARGTLQVGDQYTTRSVIDSQFNLSVLAEQQIEGRNVITAQVSGRGWIYGLSQLGYDPQDPYPQGFRLSDIWGKIP